jgi:hypothetical protein
VPLPIDRCQATRAADLRSIAFAADQSARRADDYPLGLVARAVAANRRGNPDQARRVVERLIEVQPD